MQIASFLPIGLAGFPGVIAQAGDREGFGSWPIMVIVGIFLLLLGLVMLVMFWNYLRLWFQAFVSNVPLNPLSLIGMSLRQVNPKTIIEAKITAMQAGVGTDPATGITTRRLEAHYLAGGNVPRVIRAIIAAHRADIDLDFDRAAAIDLARRPAIRCARRVPKAAEKKFTQKPGLRRTPIRGAVGTCPPPDSGRPPTTTADAPGCASGMRHFTFHASRVERNNRKSEITPSEIPKSRA